MTNEYRKTYHKRSITFRPSQNQETPQYSVTLTDENGKKTARWFMSEREAQSYIDGKNVNKERYNKPMKAIEKPDSWDDSITAVTVHGVRKSRRLNRYGYSETSRELLVSSRSGSVYESDHDYIEDTPKNRKLCAELFSLKKEKEKAERDYERKMEAVIRKLTPFDAPEVEEQNSSFR